MTLQFELDLLRYLSQNKEAKPFLRAKSLDATLFDLPEHQVVFKLLVGYLQRYPTVSSITEPGMLQFFEHERKSSKQKIEAGVADVVVSTIKSAYRPIVTDLSHIRSTIIEYMQFKRAKLMMTNYFDRLSEGQSVFSEMRGEMTQILRMEEGFNRVSGSGFLLKDFEMPTLERTEVLACHYKGLNDLTAIGGFRSPQVIVILAAPKAFKTGFLINLMVGYIRRGKKVFYADCENGGKDIRERAYQTMLGITWREMVSGQYAAPLEKAVKMYQGRGGDMYVGDYEMYKTTVADIEADLDVLRDEGWVPDIMVVDYADLLKPIDIRKERRFEIQGVYADLKNLSKRWEFPTFTLSQVNRNAVNKKVFQMSDIGEDFSKVANCDAIFALCQTKQEKKAQMARLIPVAQRKGAEYTGTEVVYFEMDKRRMKVDEIALSDFIQKVDADAAGIELDTVNDQ